MSQAPVGDRNAPAVERDTPPILRDFPDSIETERLLIRAPRRGDGLVVNEAVTESLAELQRWMPWATPAPTPADSEVFARRAQAAFLLRERLTMLMFRREDGKFLGASGFHNIDWRVPRLEIGYWCRTSETGKGYVTEAVLGLTEFAFSALGARRVTLRCDPLNVASRRVAERAGFRLEGTLVGDDVGLDGRIRDTLLFARAAGQ